MNFNRIKRKIILSLFLLLPLNACDFNLAGECGTATVEELPAPDGEYKAILYQTDCGATTGYSYHVSVLKKEDSIKQGPGKVVFGNVLTINKKVIDIKWVGKDTVQISFHGKGNETYRHADVVGSIKIRYEGLKDQIFKDG